MNKKALVHPKARNQQAKASGLLVGIPGELYFVSVGRWTDIYVEYIHDQWMAWKQSYYGGERQLSFTKTIATGELEYVLVKVNGYLSYMKNRKNQW